MDVGGLRQDMKQTILVQTCIRFCTFTHIKQFDHLWPLKIIEVLRKTLQPHTRCLFCKMSQAKMAGLT